MPTKLLNLGIAEDATVVHHRFPLRSFQLDVAIRRHGARDVCDHHLKMTTPRSG